jgi:hypothetical protein
MNLEIFLFSLNILFFSGVGFLLLNRSLRDYSNDKRSQSWPKVKGYVEHCELVDISDVDSYCWKVELQYSYIIDGNAYTGNRIGFGYAGSGFHKYHKAIYDKYVNSESIDIIFDPNNPSVSVAETGFNRSNFIMLALAIFFLVFIIIFTFLMVSSLWQVS